MYCYSNNGISWRMVDVNYIAQTGEFLFAEIPTTDQLAAVFPSYASKVSNMSLVTQIDALELTMTLRRVREAVNGTDGGWLKNLDAQISLLRNQMTK